MVEKPKMIILNIDTMVMDNDDARKREGVKVTYKARGDIQAVEDRGFVDEVKQSTSDLCELRDRNSKNEREEKRIKMGKCV